MIAALPLPTRRFVRAIAYRVLGPDALRRIKRTTAPVKIHETPEYWNGELAGRMSEPNRNARIGNALRDATTAILVRECAPAPRRVLDVGCGFGTLADALAADGLERYVGVDLSDFVIERNRRAAADAPAVPSRDFLAADLRRFDPAAHGPFDLVVFNEVLKYLEIDEAVAEVGRYGGALAEGGRICVNITGDPKCAAIFRALEQAYDFEYATVYQQRIDGPRFRLTPHDAIPAYLTAIFRTGATAA